MKFEDLKDGEYFCLPRSDAIAKRNGRFSSTKCDWLVGNKRQADYQSLELLPEDEIIRYDIQEQQAWVRNDTEGLIVYPGMGVKDKVLISHLSFAQADKMILVHFFGPPPKYKPLALELSSFRKWFDPKQEIDMSRYPHTCPRCRNPAYIGFNSIECSEC